MAKNSRIGARSSILAFVILRLRVFFVPVFVAVVDAVPGRLGILDLSS